MLLNKNLLEQIINEALSTGGNFAEVFVEDRFNTSLYLIGGEIEDAMTGRDYGVGIRIFNAFNSIYVYTNDTRPENLISVARQGAMAINKAKQDIVFDLTKREIENHHPIKIMPHTVENTKKVEMMKMAYHAAKDYDDIISQVAISYGDYEQNILIANSEGLLVEDKRVRTRTAISSVASKNGEMQTGFYGPGAHMGFEFYDTIDIEAYAKEASRMAKTMVNADHCRSGKMPVVIDNGFGGVIFHEACGHGLEATSVAKGLSVFTGKIGEKVASELITAVDDGTLKNDWGSSNIDDEGTPTQKNVLIENGILKGYMIDKLNGFKMGMEPTGSSRRQSYKLAPTSRMTNTYIDNGESTKEEIIRNTEDGLYAKHMGGGSVNPTTGEFNFAVTEGYIIKNGKIDKPVRGATLIGNGKEILNKIDMVGNNRLFGQGMCGSVSGSIPANVGQPTLRVSSITVGGREGEV